ncbi:uncharacterized protein PFL1_02583 [Pseudozyma flocculosa PF-1]|uniref:Zn(2)-C6 fungal-type domain-containing protein n=2 Tax=Pseudozyma flocculosa TaxID=84751 RepID=A0A5C3F011_9BASI|nr:uncharacterized protein PFL1_02583 [Pseudozyma flocculosa PF-1]EPQ29910.1 hypothetical protein PFL1_02583 [Pseudozyma flocculosa PF-1]SPO37216.1 uncharacterized protein PSFLO_02688 [Pseudozyma flocculosa]
MSTNAYMEPGNYSSHYGSGGGLSDRPAPLFQADAHEPRAPRPFDPQPNSDPYAAPPGAPGHPLAGPLDEPHSPLSSYRGSFSHQPPIGLPHHRQDSISSPHDVSGGWAPSSPGLASSRHASIYSLNGQFDQVGLTSGSIDGSSSSGHLYETSPPLPPQVRYAQAQAADSRRFSLDERSIRAQPGMGKPGMISAEYQAPNSGRQWPWGAAAQPGAAAGGLHGRHASVSAAAPPQSYDYARMSYSAVPGATPNGGGPIPPSPYGYDSMSAMSPTRYRSMSSSAASGRSYGPSYGAPGTAAHAAAAMGYGMTPHLGSGMMMEGEIPGGPGPARRAKFKRSRTGCLVCRKRKVKCSQDGTPCKQCRIGKRDCHYDENPQKKKGKKDKSTAAAATATGSAATTALSTDVSTDSKLSSTNGSAASIHHPHLSSQDSGYYAPPPNLDHRGSLDVGAGGSGGGPNGHSAAGVTFSMPFSSHPHSTSGSTAHSSSSNGGGPGDGTWSNPTPFSTGLSAPGPHGEAPPPPGDYGWAPKHEANGAPAVHGYGADGDRGSTAGDAYWSQHPTAYGHRAADLEHAET